MRVTIEYSDEEIRGRYNEIKTRLSPLKIEIAEIIEMDIPWFYPSLWEYIWRAFIISVCERILPELKDDPNFIRISIGKHRGKTTTTK